MLVSPPIDLSVVEARHSGLIPDNEELRPLVEQLWGDVEATTKGGSYSEALAPSFHVREGPNAFQLASSVPADSATGSELCHAFRRSASAFGLSEQGLNSIGPRAKLRRTSGNADSV